MTTLVLAYDADCGSCTRFKDFVDFLDLHHQMEFVSLIDADDLGLLDRIPKAERHTSFHLVLPNGNVLSGAAAIPRLMEALPGGAPLAKLVSSAPGGLWLISRLYGSFSKGHNGAACSYHRHITRAERAHHTRISIGHPFAGHRGSTYLSAGLVGGFAGSLAMGLFVHLPDALCIGLARFLAGVGPTSSYLAWTLHLLSGVSIGSGFGYLAAAIHLGNRKPLARSVFFGVCTGLFVWGAFFIPLMLIFLPQLVTQHLLEASLAAHVALGLVLGVALTVALGLGRDQAARSAGRDPVGHSGAGADR